ncbi:ankyrin repeat domain-containing protein [Marinicella litoralis]|uniref:Ankyrin repeat protein n=1 Tax=Marinicella litoralis TaxID=644220 RepID=A0A4V3DIR0_9GAMM|nr:ankyrin repeat domain-containing protein [Marinicella litoralis]TDR23191.1 ankyrin repeat protein [Marinicella litoralis]
MNQPLSESAKKILQCCRQGQLDYLEKHLESGIDIDDVNHPEFLPLNVALRNGRWKIARYLLQNNTVPIKSDNPPLIAATQYNKDLTTGIELIFAHTGDLAVVDKNGRTALMTACLLGHEKKVKYLLSEPSSLSNQDQMGMNAFLDAIISQSTHIVDYLLKFDLDIHHQNAQGDNALLIAVQTKNPSTKLIKTLLEHDIDCCQKNHAGKSAHSVAENKHPLIHKMFAAKIEADKQMELPMFSMEPDEQSKTKETAKEPSHEKSTPNQPVGAYDHSWFIAVSEGNLGKLNKIKVNGVPVDLVDHKGCTALIHAAGRGLRAVASYLIQNNANIEHQSNNGSTPLSSAIISNSRSVAGLLLENNANPNGTGPGDYPYISLAASQWNEACVSMLLDAGASVETLDLNGMNLYHHIAIAAEYYSNTAKAKNTTRLIIQNGLDINKVNKQGNTCLHILCGANKAKNYAADDSQLATIAHEFLKSGVNPKIVNHQGFTAIQYAKQHGLLNTKGVILSFLEAW